MKKYVLRASYCTPPLFVYEKREASETKLLNSLGVSIRTYNGPVDYRKLGFSKELVDELAKWDANFQSTFCQQDPKSSGFQNDKQKHEHLQAGLRLREKIESELSDDCKVELGGFSSGLAKGT